MLARSRARLASPEKPRKSANSSVISRCSTAFGSKASGRVARLACLEQHCRRFALGLVFGSDNPFGNGVGQQLHQMGLKIADAAPRIAGADRTESVDRASQLRAALPKAT